MSIIRFGSFEADLGAGELRDHGALIKLQQQPFKVLALLVAHPGQVVTREELRHAIWPGVAFGSFDEGLDASIYRLRAALGDSAEHPRFIETIPRRGYRFIAPVESVAPAPPNSTGKRRPIAWTIGLAVAGAFLLVVITSSLRDRLLGRAAPRRIRSIAVLPLDNLSGDSARDYFADGMTEALITDLGKVAGLRVISRTSAMHYKGTRERLPQIARELDVDAVIEGAVLEAGNRVRITTQLVDATDHHVWAESYERDLRDVLALQDEVARAVTGEVQIRLSLQEQTRLSGARRVNPASYEAYLRGRDQWNNWTEAGLRRSVDYFQESVRIDPDYAPAWAGLADAYHLLFLFRYQRPEAVMPKARAAALTALAHEETLSEAHVALAGEMWFRWSWAAAETELRRALELNPSNAMAHQWYGYALRARGEWETAIAEMRRALALDPLSPNKKNSLAVTLYMAGPSHDDEALQLLREVPDPDANSEHRHRSLAAIYERRGMPREALGELLAALRLTGDTAAGVSVQRAFRMSGYDAAKRAYLWADLRYKKRIPYAAYTPSFEIATDYALLGKRDQAIEWLETARRQHDHVLMYVNVDNAFANLHADPRFRSVVRRVGLGN